MKLATTLYYSLHHYNSIPCLSAMIETFKDQMAPKLRLLFIFIHEHDDKIFEKLMQWSEWTRMLIYVSAGKTADS